MVFGRKILIKLQRAWLCRESIAFRRLFSACVTKVIVIGSTAVRLNQQSSGILCLEICLHPVGTQTSVERDDVSLQKSDWCEKLYMGMTVTFLELKLHIQSSLNWPRTDLGYLVFWLVGKQIKSIMVWFSSMRQLGRELDEHLLSLCGPPGARQKGSILQSWCSPWSWWGLPILPQQGNLLGRQQHKSLIKYTQGKVQQQRNRRGFFFSCRNSMKWWYLLSPGCNEKLSSTGLGRA